MSTLLRQKLPRNDQYIEMRLPVFEQLNTTVTSYNLHMLSLVLNKTTMKPTLILLILGLGLTACASTPTLLPTPTLLQAGALTPYIPPTLTPTRLVPATLPSPTDTPAPTPTPFTYTVKKGDTMLAIAFNYGISLEELLAANPTVQPRMLSVGTILVIPLQGELSTPAPEPTSIPLQTFEPVCYPQADGGLWCFLPVANNQAQAVEDLSGRISLFSSSGESLGSQPAYALVDLLRPGEELPLAAFFPAPAPAYAIIQAELLGALPVAEGDPRYLSASFQENTVTITSDGLSARLSGLIQLPEEGTTAGTIQLAGVAYDAQGKIVGVRRWQVEAPCSNAAQEAGTPTPESGCRLVPFEGMIYSLGPAIDHVEILLEVKP